MRLGIVVLVVSLAGCTGGPLTSCSDEDEYMGCKIAPERIPQQWAQTSAALSGQPSALFVNALGARLIALGSADTSGGVVITPTRSASSSILPIIVTPGAPYVGFLEGPLLVSPLYRYELNGPNFGVYPFADQLDILLFSDEPLIRPERAALASVNSVGNIGPIMYPVRGRKRVSVVAQATASGVITIAGIRQLGGFDLAGAQVAGSNTSYVVDFVTGAAGAVTFGEWNGQSQYVAAGKVPGFGMFDFISVSTTLGTAGINIQAWD